MKNPIPKGSTYTCSSCGSTYPKSWTDDEAMTESKLLWGDLPAADLCVICDDCFERCKERVLTEYHANMVRN